MTVNLPRGAGQLRHEITIERITSDSTDLDSRGQQNETWGRLAVVKASVEPLRGTEAQIARQQFATATHRVVCRYVPNVTEQCRIVHRGRYLHINEVQDAMEQNRVLYIVATEEKA